MDEMLSNANPGFRSRFKQRVALPDWDAADVVEYLRRRTAKKGITFAEPAQKVLAGGLEAVRKRPGWANARDAEWLYDELSGIRAIRRSSSREEEERPTFTKADAIAALLAFDKLRPPPNNGNKRGAASRGGLSGPLSATLGEDFLHGTSGETISLAAVQAGCKVIGLYFSAHVRDRASTPGPHLTCI